MVETDIDIIQSYDKTPFTKKKSKAKWQHKNATKNFDNASI